MRLAIVDVYRGFAVELSLTDVKDPVKWIAVARIGIQQENDFIPSATFPIMNRDFFKVDMDAFSCSAAMVGLARAAIDKHSALDTEVRS